MSALFVVSYTDNIGKYPAELISASRLDRT